MADVEAFIRFQDRSGEVHYGEVPQSELATLKEGSLVKVLGGSPFEKGGFQATDVKREVKKILCPLESVPIFMCIGLNYRHHAEEAKLTVPKHPVVFTKPPNALIGPYDDVSVHPDAQSHLDYEGEFSVVIGKDAKNVKAEDALDYVLGYTVGNDVSARNFQLPDSSGGQFCYAKSFDGFAPIGPAVVTTKAIKDPQTLKYTTKVNGELRQQTGTDDMIHDVKKIIAHLSRGTTVKKGTVIMTGTPSGVGFFMEPKGFVKDGDVVEIEVEGVGKIANKMKFE